VDAAKKEVFARKTKTPTEGIIQQINRYSAIPAQ